MIAQEKSNDALYALNSVLVQARMMAFQQVPHQTLAEVLDVAALLPTLIARKDNTTAEFRSHLEGLARADSRFAPALQRFDADRVRAKPLALQTEPGGRLVGLNIHDSVVRSIEVKNDRYAEFAFDQVSGGTIRLRFEGLGPYGFVGFRDHAIAGELYLHRLGAAGIPHGAWRALWGGDVTPSDPGAQLTMDEISLRHRLLVDLVCAYGGRFACACEAAVWL